MKVPSEGLRARRRNEMGVRKEAELWPRRNGPDLKIVHVLERVVWPQRDEMLPSIHRTEDKKAPRIA